MTQTHLPDNLTLLLKAWESGDKYLEENLLTLLYQQLRLLCPSRLARNLPGVTLQATEVLSELFLRLQSQTRSVVGANRAHFFFISGRIARQVLIDEVRKRHARIRACANKIFQKTIVLSEDIPHHCEIDDALTMLAQNQEYLVQVFEMRFFVRLSFSDIASVMFFSYPQVKYLRTKAKHWLVYYLKRD